MHTKAKIRKSFIDIDFNSSPEKGVEMESSGVEGKVLEMFEVGPVKVLTRWVS